MKRQDLIRQLNSLKKTTPSEAYKLAQEKVLFARLSKIMPAQKVSFGRILVLFCSNGIRSVSLQPAVILLLLLSTFLGTSFIINAAFYSLPGDNLYALKIRLEKAQLALINDDKEKTELKIEFAKKRVYELDKIIFQPETPVNKAKKVNIAVKTLKQNIESVKEDVDKIPAKETNFKIALSLTSTSNELAETMDKSEATLSAEIKDSIEKAIDSAEETGLAAFANSISSSQKTSNEVIEFINKKISNFENRLEELSKNIPIENEKLQDKIKSTEGVLDEAKTILESEKGNINQVVLKIQAVKKAMQEIENSLKKEAEPVSSIPESEIDNSTTTVKAAIQ